MKQQPKTEHYKFFTNYECEYFPCHKEAKPKNFNCLFCYCPLYALGKECGGDFVYSENGVKDCSKCIIPHKKENYSKIIGRYRDIINMMSNTKKIDDTSALCCHK